MKHAFTKNNGYPSEIVNKILEEIRRKNNNVTELESVDQPEEDHLPETPEVTLYMCLPYKGQEGDQEFQEVFKRSFTNKIQTACHPQRFQTWFLFFSQRQS